MSGSDDLGKYFAALCNEANLKGQSVGWLIFGVQDKPRKVVGSQYRPSRASLDSLKQEIATHTTGRITFKEVHELHLPEGRVIMFEIPPAPQGIPVAWKGHSLDDAQYIQPRLRHAGRIEYEWTSENDSQASAAVSTGSGRG